MSDIQKPTETYLEIQINQSKTVFVELISLYPNIFTLKSKDSCVTLINALLNWYNTHNQSITNESYNNVLKNRAKDYLHLEKSKLMNFIAHYKNHRPTDTSVVLEIPIWEFNKENSKTRDTLENIGQPFEYKPFQDAQSFLDIPDLGPYKYLTEGTTYIGQYLDGQRHGWGKQIYENGRHYQGMFKYDLPNHKGRLIDEYGGWYEGDWANGKIEGTGIYTHTNGNKYIGDFKNEMQHGYGEETWTDGSKYEGEFTNGLKHGAGTWVWADGSKYSGHFFDNMKQGVGLYQW